LKESKKELIEVLKRVFRIEKVSIIQVQGSVCKLSSTLDESRNRSEETIKGDLQKLCDSLEMQKITDISKQANKYPNLQPLLKLHSCNFCYKVSEKHFEEKYTLVYVFHFDYQSLKILFEK